MVNLTTEGRADMDETVVNDNPIPTEEEPSAAQRGWNNAIVERNAEKARADAAEEKIVKVLVILGTAFDLSRKDTFNGGPNALHQGAVAALAYLKGEAQ